MELEQIKAALDELAKQRGVADWNEKMGLRESTTDDLRNCASHQIPINACARCWPLFMRHLGNLTNELRAKS